MNGLQLELDCQINNMEPEWCMAYEASIRARAEYQTMAADPRASVELLDIACERLERAEAKKARIMAILEQLELSMHGKP